MNKGTKIAILVAVATAIIPAMAAYGQTELTAWQRIMQAALTNTTVENKPASTPSGQYTVTPRYSDIIYLSREASDYFTVDAACAPGEIPTGGGLVQSGGLNVVDSHPVTNSTFNGWQVKVWNDDRLLDSAMMVSVVCLSEKAVN